VILGDTSSSQASLKRMPYSKPYHKSASISRSSSVRINVGEKFLDTKLFNKSDFAGQLCVRHMHFIFYTHLSEMLRMASSQAVALYRNYMGKCLAWTQGLKTVSRVQNKQDEKLRSKIWSILLVLQR